ncbi:MAG: nickel-dependent lactate racemase [Candidatus Methanoperedens sp.]|nr:nickel-dependent lactate racemase [Candidatus Methanoperedens sp.]
MLIHLPYGKKELSFEIPENCSAEIIKPVLFEGIIDGTREIKQALDSPINSKRLFEISEYVKKAIIIVNDITRPTPTSLMLPPVISELRSGGVEDITVVFGLGIHRKQTEYEKKNILGDLYGKVKSIEHDVNDCIYLGKTARGTPVEIFKPVAEADIVICTGTIELHYYAGYSGGAKSILPAVSSKRSIYANHALMLEEGSCAGRAHSPVREDIEEAGRILGIDFILNVVLNEKKEIIHAVAGDYKDAHRNGAAFLDKISKIKVEYADIIVVSAGGWPRDIDIFQSYKAIEHAKNAVRKGGSIILVAECKEGYGNRIFEEWLNYSRDEVIEKFRSGFVMGAHKAALIAALSKKIDLYLVSSLADDTVRKAYFIPASPDGVLEMVLGKYGKNARVIVMPYGGSTLATGE